MKRDLRPEAIGGRGLTPDDRGMVGEDRGVAPDDRGEAPGHERLVLEVHDLRAGYGKLPVLRGVSFSLREGEALGIVGHNGMGKTTLLRTIMGFLPVTGGRIVIDGTDVTREPPHMRSRRGVGYVAQGRGILPALSTLENLRLAWTGDSDESEHEAVDRVLGLFPRLEPLLERRGGALSGGEQQLLALARALVGNPWVVLLDEPSEGVQPSLVLEIGRILAQLRKQAGLSMVIVEQNLDLVLDLATRIAVMEKGRTEREFFIGQAAAVAPARSLPRPGPWRRLRGRPVQGSRRCRASAYRSQGQSWEQSSDRRSTRCATSSRRCT
jgi:amidase